MSMPGTSSAEFFEAKYRDAADGDPWSFATAEYELGRYDAVMRALAGRRYGRAFEPGCSVGVLTERLAAVCDAVDACDFSATAVGVARERCALLPQVSVRCAALGADEAWGEFDLIVLCEIGYYFMAAAWQELVERMVRDTRPGTVVLACHWLGTSADHVQGGEAVHAALRQTELVCTLSEHHTDFLLERWTRTR